MRRKVSIKDVGPKGIGLVAKVTLLISPFFFFSGVRCAYAVSPCCLSRCRLYSDPLLISRPPCAAKFIDEFYGYFLRCLTLLNCSYNLLMKGSRQRNVGEWGAAWVSFACFMLQASNNQDTRAAAFSPVPLAC